MPEIQVNPEQLFATPKSTTIVDVEHSSFELWALIFRALADNQPFAVELRMMDPDGKPLQYSFHELAERPPG